MNALLTILSITFVLVAIPRIILKYKRKKYALKLESVYDEMEMFFVRKNIPLKNKYVELLKAHKNIVKNPELLDIQLLLLIKMSAEKTGRLESNRNWFRDTINSLPNDFNRLVNDFNIYSDKLILMSSYRPDFLIFVLKLMIKNSISKRVSAVKAEIKFVMDNESIILRTGRQMRMAA